MRDRDFLSPSAQLTPNETEERPPPSPARLRLRGGIARPTEDSKKSKGYRLVTAATDATTPTPHRRGPS